MSRHAGPRPRLGAARAVLVLAAIACVVGAVLAVVAHSRDGSRPTAGTTAPAGPATPLTDPEAAPGPSAPDGSGQRAIVVGVADAVTLDVRLPDGRDVVRVRALGIQGPGPCYADESTAFARRVLGGQAVDLVAGGIPGSAEPTPDAVAAGTPVVDRFDRRLQRVVLDGGRDYAVLAAEAGIARTYSAGAAPATMPPIRDAEARARASARGLWGPPCAGNE